MSDIMEREENWTSNNSAPMLQQQDFSEPKYTSPTKTDSLCKGRSKDLDQSVLKLEKNFFFLSLLF